MLKLVEMDATPEAILESAFASMVEIMEKSDVDSVGTGGTVETDTFAGDVDTENNTEGEQESKSSGESAYHSAAETDSSVVELKVPKKNIVYHNMDS